MRFGPAIAVAAIWTLIPCSIASLGAAGTPLIDAVRSRDADRVKSLVKARADVNAPQGDGSTALQWAVHLDDVTLVDYLLESGARVETANDLGVTPLYISCTNRNGALTERLLKAGANPNAALPNGETVLMNCARTGSTQGVHALLAKGARANDKETAHDQTALMWAAAQGQSEAGEGNPERGDRDPQRRGRAAPRPRRQLGCGGRPLGSGRPGPLDDLAIGVGLEGGPHEARRPLLRVHPDEGKFDEPLWRQRTRPDRTGDLPRRISQDLEIPARHLEERGDAHFGGKVDLDARGGGVLLVRDADHVALEAARRRGARPHRDVCERGHSLQRDARDGERYPRERAAGNRAEEERGRWRGRHEERGRGAEGRQCVGGERCASSPPRRMRSDITAISRRSETGKPSATAASVSRGRTR